LNVLRRLSNFLEKEELKEIAEFAVALRRAGALQVLLEIGPIDGKNALD
jgi:hypothetical protein